MLKKIAITGPESTGKSDLAEALAKHYNTQWVPEYAREYIDNLDRPYRYEDIEQIARGQLKIEKQKEATATNLLICDTEFLVTKIWSKYVFGHCSQWILEQVKHHTYDLYLLMDIDLPWQDDPQREHPHKRQELFSIYKQELVNNGFDFRIVSGYGAKRVFNAIQYVDDLMNI